MAAPFVILTPCYNAGKNLENICRSVLSQTYQNWSWVIADDCSSDNITVNVAKELLQKDNRIKCCYSNVRNYALKNICNVVDNLRDVLPDVDLKDCIVGVVDGDDQLCNNNALQLIANEYEKGADVVWTAHKWDVDNNINISSALPEKVNPYQYPWCASHFRTFKKSLFGVVNKKNFLDADGNWFKRGYDQALMLPMLKLARKRIYIPEVCYQYNIRSVSMDRSKDTTSEQQKTVAFVRARGLIS